MKFQIASDLHLECLHEADPDATLRPAPGADALILAGDIAVGTAAWDAFDDWPIPVLYVPGNHEYFGGDLPAVRADLRRRGRSGSLVLLDGTRHQLRATDGCLVRVLGTTLWTDFRVGEPDQPQAAAMVEAQRRMRDYRRIRWNDRALVPQDILEEHTRQRAWLADALAEPFEGTTVVITHHGPSRRSIHPHFADYPGNGAFVSALDELLGRTSLWVHGHSHRSVSYCQAGCRVVTNPRGYRVAPGTWENPAFDPCCLIEA